MKEMIKNFHLQSFGSVRSALLGLSSMLLLLLIPTHPLGGESGHGMDRIDSARVSEIHETLNIYSILMSHRTDLSKASLWSTAETILEESKRHSLDPLLVLALIRVESRFRHAAVSTRGARGLMQIRPHVGAALAAEAEIENWQGAKSLDDPILNVKLGIFYLGELKARFRDLNLALSAYNLGPTEVEKRLEEGEAIPSRYVSEILAFHRSYNKEKREMPVAFHIAREKQEAGA